MFFKIAIRLVYRALAAASLLTGTACVQDTPKVIAVGDLNAYLPFAFKDIRTGEFTGFDHDLFDAMAKKVGAKVKWEFFSFTDLASFAPLRTGHIDIYGGSGMVGHPAKRAQGVSFIDFVYEPFVFHLLKANAAQFNAPEALCGKTCCHTPRLDHLLAQPIADAIAGAPQLGEHPGEERAGLGRPLGGGGLAAVFLSSARDVAFDPPPPQRAQIGSRAVACIG